MKNLQLVILVGCLFYNCLASADQPPDNRPPPACSTALGMEKGGIRDNQIFASSQLSRQARASLARLNEDRDLEGWCAHRSDKNPYLQIDLLMPHTITKLAIQGAANNWVKNFSLAFSYDNITWFNYTVNGILKYFNGPRNQYGKAWNNLMQPLTARAVRFYPVYDISITTCLKVELYGCLPSEDCNTPVGVEDRKISDQQISASSHWNQHYGFNGRLNNQASSNDSGSFTSGGWCTDRLDKNQYLQIDLGRVRSLSGVATQGYIPSMFVSSYRVNYSTDGYTWHSYKNRGDSRSKIFKGNWDNETVKKEVFTRRIFARYIRFNPLAWNANGYICMRVEIYECLPTKGSVPEVGPPSETMELNRTSSVNLTCLVSGQPGARMEWYKNDLRIPDAHLSIIQRTQYGNGSVKSVLTLKRVKYRDRGSNVSCTAWYPSLSINATRNIHLLVHAPRPVMAIIGVQSRTVQLRVTDPTPTDTAEYIVRYKTRSFHSDWVPVLRNKTSASRNTVITLDGLHPYTTYLVELASRYKDGDEGPYSIPHSFATGQAAPPSIYYVDPPTETGIEENVTLTCHASGLPQPTFTWITPDGHAVNATAPVYESEVLHDGSENRRGKIVQEDGSLLIFNTRVVDQGVYECVAINVMGQDNKTVNLTVKEDLVGVDVAITIENEVFDKDLENKSSLRYKKLEEQHKQELTELLKDIEGFEKVAILGFLSVFNGSVKVRFRVVVNVSELEDKEPLAIANKVGRTLRSQMRTVEFAELPPPPVNVQAADVKQTEAVVTWSHPELYDMYAISSYSLQLRKFGTKSWTQLTNTRGLSHRLTNLDPDTAYSVRLKSENKYGKGKPSDNGELRTEKVPEGHGLMLALVIIFVLVLVIMGIAAVFVYRRWKKKRSKNGNNTPEEEVPMNPVTTQPTETIPHTSTIQASFPWREIPRDRLTLSNILGEGEFGMVVKGELTEDDGHITPCAVKKLKNCATENDLKDLKNELDIMDSVGHHPNLVNLIGACSSEGPLMIVVEFAEHGNLHRYLRDHRKQNYDDMNKYSLDISSAERLRIACDVAEGMKHLASMRWVHRDLAARNVLLGEGMVAKVADFGLARDLYTTNVYEKKSGGKVPVKWLALESLEQGLYTSQSDVWSFGVLLWEIETGGCTPYAGISTRDLLPHLKAGYRLDKPHYCSAELYSVMRGCWNANPKSRPTFEELSDELRQMRRTVAEYLTPAEMEPSNDYLTLIL